MKYKRKNIKYNQQACMDSRVNPLHDLSRPWKEHKTTFVPDFLSIPLRSYYCHYLLFVISLPLLKLITHKYSFVFNFPILGIQFLVNNHHYRHITDKRKESKS